MLTEKQIKEIREHLEKAQNPLFYYDNDVDGLCSYLLLRRFISRGKGVAVKSYPDLNAEYAKKAYELNADYVFILDKPLISKEFTEEIERLGIPAVWVDHHDLEAPEFLKEKENFFTYNPNHNSGKDKSNEPVTYLAYKINGRKEDLWIAVMGCIADNFMPDFIDEFKEKYPEFYAKSKGAFDVYYKSEIGRITRALSFGLKDSISKVIEMQNFLLNCQGPGDVLAEINGNKALRERNSEIMNKYSILLEKAKDCWFGDLLFFDYSGDLSISAELANELSYLNKGKYVAVAYRKGDISNISLRGKGVKSILEKVLKGFEDARGGGHEDAVGARARTGDLAKFREALEKEIKLKQEKQNGKE